MPVNQFRFRFLALRLVIALVFVVCTLSLFNPSVFKHQSIQAISRYYSQPNFSKTRFNETEFDYSKIEYKSNNPVSESEKNTLLIVSNILDGTSFGKDRTFKDLFDTIMSFNYNPSLISLSLLVSSDEELGRIEQFFDHYFDNSTKITVNQVTLLQAPFIEKDFKGFSRENRHNDMIQRLRRRQIARVRNFSLFNSLKDEKYTLFIDSDIIKIEHPDMIHHFIDSGKDIIVPRIIRGGNQDYDKNSWRGQRTKPTNLQLEKMDKGEWDTWDYVPKDVQGKMFHFQTFYDENNNKPINDIVKKLNHLVELDSVGGAILFAKSIIYKQGVIFPTNYIIGTTWDRLEGYDGIETEGVCYIAKSMGYSCWGMPNLLAQHDP